MKRRWTGLLTENFSYKVVALFISLVLWLTILGRRDFTLYKEMKLELLASEGSRVEAQTATQVQVKVSGSRAALKKFLASPLSQTLVLDISHKGEGVVDVDIPVNKVEVPLGIRVLGVRPNELQVEVVKAKGTSNEGKKEQ